MTQTRWNRTKRQRVAERAKEQRENYDNYHKLKKKGSD